MIARDRMALGDRVSAEHWRAMEPLLDQALDTDPSERDSFYEMISEGNAELRAELERLVVECERPEASLDSPLPARFPSLFERLPVRPLASLADRFRIEREIGRGGMATVYLARDLRNERDVAIKVLHPELAAVVGAARFHSEVRVSANLQHPNILPLFESGDADGELYYVMPYVAGESLRSRLRRELQLSVADSLRIAGEVASALDSAHRLGVIHRDIKPENILLQDGQAFVVDFGIAVSVTHDDAERLTQTGISIGTPQYMSPEQAAGQRSVDARSDIYSLGAVLYEMLAGEAPYTGPTPQAVIAKMMSSEPPSVRRMRPGVSVGLDAVVRKALAHVPGDRFSSASELAAALEAVPADDFNGVPKGAKPLHHGHRPTKLRRLGLVAAGVLTLVAGGGAIVRYRSRDAVELDPKRVVIGTFENHTGNPSLDDLGPMTADWIARSLTTAEILEMSGTSDEISTRMNNEKPVAAANIGALAHLARAGLVVSGSYYQRQDSLLFQANITDAVQRSRVQSIGPVATHIQTPHRGVEEIRMRVTGALAVLVDSSLVGVATHLSQAPSLDSYREYLEGEYYFYRDARKAADHLLAAFRLDTTFTWALIRAAFCYWRAGDPQLSDSTTRVLELRRDRMSPLEKATLDYDVAYRSFNDSAKVAAARRMVAAAPRSALARYNLADAYQMTAPERTRESLEILESLDPLSGGMRGRTHYFRILSSALHDLGDTARAVEAVDRGRSIFGPRLQAFYWQMLAYASAGRLRQIDSLVPIVLSAPKDLFWTPKLVLLYTALELRAHGHPDAAKRIDAVLGRFEREFMSDGNLGDYYAEVGKWRELRTTADSLLRNGTPQTDSNALLVFSGVALGRMGNKTAALKRLSQVKPDDLFGPGVITLALGDTSKAISILQQWIEKSWCERLCHLDPLLIDLWQYPPYKKMVRPH